jgi:hypothetical protein
MKFKKGEYYYSENFKVPIEIIEFTSGKKFKNVKPHTDKMKFMAYFLAKPHLYSRYSEGFVENWEPRKITKEEFDLYIVLSFFRKPKIR